MGRTVRTVRSAGLLALFGVWSLLGHGLAMAQDGPDDQAAADDADADAGADADADAGDGDREQAATMGESGDAGSSPWADGVSPEDQAEAQRLFVVGNKALDEGDFSGAEEALVAAVARWNHPAIQYNLVLALIGKKGDPVRIFKALEQATRFGAAPLEPTLFERAVEYMGIYGKQLGTLEISCDEPDAKVTLDGKLVFTGPGQYKDVVLAGEHTIAATKPDYIAVNKTLALDPEETERIEIRMFTLEDRTSYTRRFPAWLPWTVAVGGAAFLGVGGGLHYVSNQNRTEFNDQASANCPCPPGEIDTELRDTADTQELGAYIAYGLGGAAVTVGVVMIFLNQPKKNVDLGADEDVAVRPILAPDRFGISASLRF